jgi:hypothetical protein
VNERHLSIGNVAAGAVVIGGLLLVVLPQHAPSVLRLVIVTVAAAAGLHALATTVPPTGWLSPFKLMSPFGRRAPGGGGGGRWDELDPIRRKMGGWRQPMAHGPPLPPEVVRLLKNLAETALDLDSERNVAQPSARPRLSPTTWAILTSEPETRPPWFRMRRPNRRKVAKTVVGVLDELDRLAPGTLDPRPSDESRDPRGP